MNDTIKNEDVAVGLRLEDEDVLVLGLFNVKDLLDPGNENEISSASIQLEGCGESTESSLEGHSLAYSTSTTQHVVSDVFVDGHVHALQTHQAIES